MAMRPRSAGVSSEAPVSPNRDRRLVLAGIAAALLTACGFRPRGSVRLPFSSLYVQAPANTPFGQELRRALRASDVRLEETKDKAAATLNILGEIREKHILSLGGTGRVREYQLRYRVAYEVTAAKAGVVAPRTEILLTRDISYSDQDALGKESEEGMLYRDMQSDAVQQLLRRLQAIKLAGP